MISDEDFYGGRTGPLEKLFFYLFKKKIFLFIFILFIFLNFFLNFFFKFFFLIFKK